MEVYYHRKSEEDILASASFADRQLEYDTLKSLQLKVIMSFLAGKDVFAILPEPLLCSSPAPFCSPVLIAKRFLQLLPE